MYRKKDRMGQREAKIVRLEDLVPQDHLLRKIEASIDFEIIYDEVKGMYSEIEWGSLDSTQYRNSRSSSSSNCLESAACDRPSARSRSM